MRVGKHIGLRLILNKQVIIRKNVRYSDLESLLRSPHEAINIALILHF